MHLKVNPKVTRSIAFLIMQMDEVGIIEICFKLQDTSIPCKSSFQEISLFFFEYVTRKGSMLLQPSMNLT